MTNESGPEAGVEGVVEDVKGRAKEAAGAVTGNESMKEEGQAHKAAAQRDVAAKEAEAEKARAEARAAEAEQQSHQ